MRVEGTERMRAEGTERMRADEIGGMGTEKEQME